MSADKKQETCSRCNGFGHDKAGKPVVKFETRKDDQGRAYKQHITVSQGSGCIKCLGLGKV